MIAYIPPHVFQHIVNPQNMFSSFGDRVVTFGGVYNMIARVFTKNIAFITTKISLLKKKYCFSKGVCSLNTLYLRKEGQARACGPRASCGSNTARENRGWAL